MSQMTDYLENKLIDHIFRGQQFAFPATLYVSLHTANPGETGANELTSAGSYARASIASTLANWAATQGGTTASTGSSGQTSNNVTINFPTPSTGWGVVTHFAVWDSPTGGNALLYGQLTISKTINQADTVSFAAGALTATFA